jgi:sugar (pentulose or hexulose) kinase
MKILALDFGTSSIKLSLLDDIPSVLKSFKVPYSMRVYNGNWSEIDGKDILAAMYKGIKALGEDTGGTDLIVFDNFSPSLSLMDKEGNPILPIFTHLDRRSKKQTQDILAHMGKEKFQSLTGIQPFTGGASITSLLWVKENMSSVFREAWRVGHLNTFIYKKLTGLWCTDPVNASMTGMYETITRKGWSEEICRIFGIPPALLPDIINAGTIAGTLNRETAELCGLKEGIPVALGSNDAASAQAGAGNFRAGNMLNISGSSEMISVLTDEPRINDRYYLRCAVTPGLWQIYAITASGFVLDWFRREFYRDMSEDAFFSREFPAVVDGFLDTGAARFLPYLAGDRQSLVPKKGAFTELTLETKREDFLAAILLGIHEPIRMIIDICGSFMDLDKTIKLTGGMIDPAFLKVKQKIFPDYSFEIKPDCPVIGSARLGLEGLNSRRV